MARISVLNRDAAVEFPQPGQVHEVVAVTYVSDVFGPRILNLPAANYREATPVELKANPRYRMVPKDVPAKATETQAISQDFEAMRSARPEAFNVP